MTSTIAAGATTPSLGLSVRRSNANEYLLAAVHELIPVLEEIAVDLIRLAKVAMSVSRVMGAHVVDTSHSQVFRNGFPQELWICPRLFETFLQLWNPPGT
jgi:hypothetical protein